MSIDENREPEKRILIAMGVVIDDSKTLVKLFQLSFTGFRANRTTDEQHFHFRNDCALDVTTIMDLCEYSNKTVVDIELERSALWLLINED